MILATLLAGFVALASTATALLRRRLVAVTVSGGSMLPTYQPGDRVMVRRGVMPVRGGVVVVELPDTMRCRWDRPPGGLGNPGERVTERSWLLKRVKAVSGDFWTTPTGETARVPPRHMLLLGDNAPVSFDSRHIGPFPESRVLGSVWRPPKHRPMPGIVTQDPR